MSVRPGSGQKEAIDSRIGIEKQGSFAAGTLFLNKITFSNSARAYSLLAQKKERES